MTVDRIFLAGPSEDPDRETTMASLKENGWAVVVNTKGGIKSKIQDLLECQAICLSEIWWTDKDSWLLQQVAGWCQMTHIDVTGHPTEMVSRRR